MKVVAAICIVFIIAVVFAAKDKKPKYKCPSGWTRIDKLCVFITSMNTTFFNGLAVCGVLGGRLLEIPDEKTQGKIADLMAEVNLTEAWLGGNSFGPDGEWEWNGGLDFDEYDNWLDGEPGNATDGNCLSIRAGGENVTDLDWSAEADSDYQWIANDCLEELPVICQRFAVKKKKF